MRALKPHLMSIHRDPPLTTEQRVLLRRQTSTIYAGELNDAAAYYGMDEDLLRRSFSLIVGSWSN